MTTDGITIRGPRLLLRPLTRAEIDVEWNAMVGSDPMSIAVLPDEQAFRARLERSGRMVDGWLDLAIDLGGRVIGRIQTFVPAGRPLGPGVFDVGIDLREDARGKGCGTEALRLLTDWLFREAGAQRVEASTDPANAAMRAVFEKVGWALVGTLHEFEREWVLYALDRDGWLGGPGAPG
jgi:RimJ/RimL family protein N-acetyltransferase